MSFYKKIKSNHFIKSILLVVSGTAAAQAITFLFYPLITRLYGPEAFGTLGAFVAIMSLATAIAALTYPIAIVLPKEDDKARRIAKLSVLIAFVFALAISVVIVMFGSVIADVFSINEISSFLILIPIAMFFAALQQVMQQWLIRKKQFKIVARVAVSQSLVLNLTKAGGGLIYPSGLLLIILTVLGDALHAFQLWLGSLKSLSRHDALNLKTIKNSHYKETAMLYKDFPLYRAPETFVYAFSESIVVIALAAYYDATIVGFFTLSRLAMMAPTSLIGTAVNNVLYPKAAELSDSLIELRSLFLKATAGILLVAGLPFLLIVIIGPTVFRIVFGDEWLIAGEYARWVSIWLIFFLAARPAITLFPVLNIQRLFLASQVFFLFLKAVALWIGGSLVGTASSMVILYSLTSALSFIALICLAYLSLQKRIDVKPYDK